MTTNTDLWAALEAQPRPTRAVDFPRRGPKGEELPAIHMRVLTQQEQSAAAAAAHDFARKHLHEAQPGESLGYDMLFGRRYALEIIVRASVVVADGGERRAFPSVDEMARVLTVPEGDALMAHYEATLEHFDPAEPAPVGPPPRDLAAEIDAMAARLHALESGGLARKDSRISLTDVLGAARHFTRSGEVSR